MTIRCFRSSDLGIRWSSAPNPAATRPRFLAASPEAQFDSLRRRVPQPPEPPLPTCGGFRRCYLPSDNRTSLSKATDREVGLTRY